MERLSAYYSRDSNAIKQNPGELLPKQTHSKPTLLVCLSILVAVGLACNSRDKESTSNAPANTTPANGATSPGSAAPPVIAGSYAATGTNPDGTAYAANLVVTARGDVYQFSWDSAGRAYDGVGVASKNKVAVSFTDGKDGKGCGVVLYDINPDGSLNGKSGYWGVDSQEKELATRTSGTGLEGKYDITGSNPGGTDYKGTLDVSQSGTGYSFKWKAGETFDGFGIRTGDTIAVGFGGSKCAFVSYDVKPDGTLDGKWGASGSSSTGTEVAKKK